MTPELPIHDELIFQGKLLTFTLRTSQLQDGTMVSREIVGTHGAVVIVPVTANHEVRLVRQYRAAAQKWIIELPAGGLEPNEDPVLAAPRELLEETGDRSETWQSLGGFYTAPGILTEYLHLYLATNLIPGPNQLEFDEHIQVITVPWAEAMAMIRRHDIEDAKTVTGLVRAALYLGLPLN